MKKSISILLLFFMLAGLAGVAEPLSADYIGITPIVVEVYLPGTFEALGTNYYAFSETGALNQEDCVIAFTELPAGYDGDICFILWLSGGAGITIDGMPSINGLLPAIETETGAFRWEIPVFYNPSGVYNGIAPLMIDDNPITISYTITIPEGDPWFSLQLNGVDIDGYSFVAGLMYVINYGVVTRTPACNLTITPRIDGLSCVKMEYISNGDFVEKGDWRNWSIDFDTTAQYALLAFSVFVDDEFIGNCYISITYAPRLYVSVNGSVSELDFVNDGILYDGYFTVYQETGNQIRLVGTETAFLDASYPDSIFYYDYTYGDFTMAGTDWTSWTLDFLDPLAIADLSIYYSDPTSELSAAIRLSFVYSDSPPYNGGDTAEEEEDPIDVVNETNEPNYSSDTTLTPKDTKVIDGLSVTNVTGREIDALIKLAEAHAGDVEEGENEAIISIRGSDPKIDGFVVNLKGGDIQKIVESSIDLLAFNTAAGQFRIRNEAIDGLNANAADAVQLRMTKLDHEGRPGLDAQLVVASKVIRTVNGIYTTEIRIPYILRPGEDPSAILIEYINDDGVKKGIGESWYDGEKKMLVCYLTHMSKYGVAYKPVLFSDVGQGHWAGGYITFLASRGVIDDPPGSRFRPDDTVTRAEFIQMAARAFAVANLGNRSRISYGDVDPQQRHSLALSWSYINNISSFMASGRSIYPDKGLTREEAAAFVNNVSLGLRLRLREVNTDVEYKDNGAISAACLKGVLRMSACGIVFEAGGGGFFPQSACTRAEAAQTISLLMSKIR